MYEELLQEIPSDHTIEHKQIKHQPNSMYKFLADQKIEFYLLYMMPMVQNVVHCLAIEQASMHQFFLVFIKAQKLFRKKEANMRRKTLLKNSES